MNDYDFRTLNDKEFEIMCTDLLSFSEGCRFERFKPGKDQGVDGRFFKSDGTETILQCKHWVSAPLERLIKHLKSEELPKVSKLKPSRYIVAVSHKLSRTDKATIQAILQPHVISPADVLGQEDLNDLLAKFPDVERRHYKLWIASSSVLQYFINKPIHDRSSFLLDEMRADAHLYVPTSNHDKALHKLESMGSAIITGPAGIGKTTLANHLALHYVSKGFQFFQIADEIKEAEAVFEPSLNQIFYFDDFLGRNYLEALSGHEGSHIVQFVKRVSRDRKKRFILTSRSTILNQGKLLSDVFINNNLNRNEYEVTLSSFTEMDKAQMLYSHLWHSRLETTYIDELYLNKRYRSVIAHPNFNPRLIKYLTQVEKVDAVEPSNYWKYITDILSNPRKVWENPFEAQHDDFGRALVLLVTLNRQAISDDALAEAFNRYISMPDNFALAGKRDFLLNIRHLSGSLLSREIMDGKALGARFNLFNPSIGDYVLHRYVNDAPSLRAGFCSLRSVSSLSTLANLWANKLLHTDLTRGITDQILRTATALNFVGFSSEYVAKLVSMQRKIQPTREPSDAEFSQAIQFVANAECPSQFADVAALVDWALDKKELSIPLALRFVEKAIDSQPDLDEFERLGSIIAKFDLQSKRLIESIFTYAVVDYLTDSVYDEFPSDEVFANVGHGDYRSATGSLATLVLDKLENLGVVNGELHVDEIVNAFDVRLMHDQYFDDSEPADEQIRPGLGSKQFDEIDDLFERNH